MNTSTQYIVYNASAGSGKTYTLVRDYLKLLFTHKDPFYFRHILAITFTNKASLEMKERIMHSLQDFSINHDSDLANELRDFAKMNAEQFKAHAVMVYQAILNDYSGFNITTIDSFTHNIVRTFALDFGLTNDFDIELDAKKILSEAVDAIIAQIGKDEKLTEVLVNFSLQQSDDDKAWDISQNLYDFAEILLNESDRTEFKSLLDKKIDDYESLKKKLHHIINSLQSEIKSIGASALQIIEDNGLVQGDFLRGSIPKHFENLTVNWDSAKFFEASTVRKNIENGDYYAKSKSQDIKSRIEQIMPSIAELYYQSEQVYSKIKTYDFWYKSLFPMALLNYVFNALEEIKSEHNVQFISDFNELIQSKVKNEPAPFIYERLGEKFKHYFIDEMQDTSVLQWDNLIALIDNAMSQEGSLLLVGDAKQSIYRWRGGVPEQFIHLARPDSNLPFHVEKQVESLETNYRSYSHVIDFNNAFFANVSGIMRKAEYKWLYDHETTQHYNSKTGGYVQLEFMNPGLTTEERKEFYPQKVLEIIQQIDKGFELKDICVLVRFNTHGNIIAQYLTENGIPVLSSENLLLSQNTYINFLINTLHYFQNPSDKVRLYNMLDFLWSYKQVKLSQHDFISQLIDKSESEVMQDLVTYGIHFQVNVFYTLPLYDAVEYCIRVFEMNSKSDVYLLYFLEIVLDFQSSMGSDFIGFLEYWEQKREQLSISVPENKNAVKIMSVHKSKGLQFPVVIFPYDLEIYKVRNDKVWYQMEESMEDFDKVLINFREDLKFTDLNGRALYEDFKAKKEFDNINLLYVALTRAVEQLYIITDYHSNTSGLKLGFYSGWFMHFIQNQNLFEEGKNVYTFGNATKVSSSNVETDATSTNVIFDEFISSDPQDHRLVFYTKGGELWETEQGKAINFGNLIHEILSSIVTADELDMVLANYVQNGLLPQQEIQLVKTMVEKVLYHPLIKKYYEQNHQVMSEREMVDNRGHILIPDRIVFFSPTEIGLLDYKTGVAYEEHQQQVNRYAKVLQEMGYKVVEKYLVYIGEDEVNPMAIGLEMC